MAIETYDMNQRYIPAHQFVAKAWANGTTTELVKYPEESDFLKRDFIFRISTATVEAEESTFSDFSGLTRILVILEGSLTLIHEGRYQKQLSPYEQDTFDGAWSTRSVGKVRDFNLMFNAQARGEVRVLSLSSDHVEQIMMTQKRMVFFVHTGAFILGEHTLEAGSVLDLSECNSEILDLHCCSTGNVICCAVEML